jgi:hypothetical protein
MGGWVDGLVAGKAGLRIAYSNQKLVELVIITGIFLNYNMRSERIQLTLN